MPPSPDQNKLYSIYKTTAWFAVASIVLLASLIMMVGQDYAREWKGWQRKFVEFEREKVKKDIEKAGKSVDTKKLAALQAKLKEAQAELDRKKQSLDKLAKEKEPIELTHVKAKSKYQTLKQFYDSTKYFYEEALEKGEKEKANSDQKKLSGLAQELAKAKIDLDAVEGKIDGIDKTVQAANQEHKDIEKEINQLLKDQKLFERREKQLEHSAAKAILNAPMLDFVAPSLQIQQVVLEDLTDDLYFAKAQKVDRCTTCHLAIDRKGFEDAPEPFRSHPNLDLFLSASSKHPLEKVGCTVCHGGSGQSLSFVWAAHTPKNEEQKKEWEKKYEWHELEKWENKMLPLGHIQASCTKCHQGVIDLPEAPQLNAGRRIAMEYGCFGCHTAKGFENAWKVGPNLTNIKSKVSPEWVMKWLEGPKEFRPSTKMPSVFHLENTNSKEDKEKNQVAIWGIALYLIKNSGTIELEKAPQKKGDPEVGKKLVQDIGCLGCHSAEGVKVNNRGPELINLGSKVTSDWLYAWLKDPKHYSPDTRMPSLRLSEDEIINISAYLLQSKNEKFEKSVVPEVSDESLNHFVMDYLSHKMRRSEAQAEFDKMDKPTKFEFVGKEMISQQGCFGCHAIQGFETAKPIGTELTKEGQRQIDKFDFGFIDIGRTREDFFFQKLKHPRSFDHGKLKEYQEKLRMPEFGFTDEQAASLTTFLLSLRDESIPLHMQRRLDLADQAVEKGKWIVAQYNCQGCHTVDGGDGRVRSLFSDLGNAPPVLNGEGAKIQEKWLYEFLHGPTPIRPWLKYRMPTFGFKDDQLNTLVRYFSNGAHQEPSYTPNDAEKASAEDLAAGKQLFIKFKCIQCHQSAVEGMTASFLAPNLTMAKNRLKSDWVIEWLKDPQVVQSGTMMPTFFADKTTPVKDMLGGDWLKQIHAIRNYLWTFTSEEESSVKNSTGK